MLWLHFATKAIYPRIGVYLSCQFQIVRRHEKQLHYLWSIYTYLWSIVSNLITFHAENFFYNANCIALPASFQCVKRPVCDFVKGKRSC